MTKREIFAADSEFIICMISDEDRKDYVELHRQLNGETSLYLNPRSKDMMWEQTLNHAESIFSLFTADGEYCGSIELQHPDSDTPEIGIDLLERGITVNIKMLIQRIKGRPQMFVGEIGEFSLEILSSFIRGFLYSNINANRAEIIDRTFMDEFHDWVT